MKQSSETNETVLKPAHRLMAAGMTMDFSSAVVGLGIQNLGVYILDAPNLVLGLFGALGPLAYAAGCFSLGSLSDRHGRFPTAAAGIIMVAFAWMLIPHLGSWKYVLCAVPLTRGVLALFWPSIQAWLGGISRGRRELTRNLGLFNIMWCTGLMLGPVVSGFLWNISPYLDFYVPAGLCLLLLFLLSTIPIEKRNQQPSPPESKTTPATNDMFLKLAWSGNFASWFMCGTVCTMFPKLGHTMGLTPLQVGWTIAALRLGQAAMFAFTRYQHRWQYRLWPLVTGQCIAAIGLVAAVMADTAVACAVGFALAGMCAGLTYVSSLFYSLQRAGTAQGRNSGKHEAVLGAGIFLGPLVGGITAQWINLKAPFLAAAAVMIAACMIQIILLRLSRNPVKEPTLNPD